MKKRFILKQLFAKVILVLIAFFSLLIKVDASSFAYNAFDWDLFYEENKGYWIDYCDSNNANISEEECMEITLSGKKDYYVDLYKLLAKYERTGYKLDDNILLVTSFYYLTPDSFSTLPEEYLRDYIDGSAYNLDGDIDTYDVNSDFTKEYFEGEADSLKMLTKHMFGYSANCTDSEGEILDTYALTYTEYLISKWNFIGQFFGVRDKFRAECESSGGTYNPASGKKEINYDVYWRFLEETEYLDNKVHLTAKYSTVLEKTNHQLMKELSTSEKEQYHEELIEIRKDIVLEMKSIYESYGEYAQTPDSYIFAGSNSAWWPIGSDEITDSEGVKFAVGNPPQTVVKSKFGPRIHPITKKNSQHTGIDISGVKEGETNIIAIKDGVVVYPTEGAPTNCPTSNSLDSCGGGYGNYVVIQHNDGTYSVYAHLYQGSITVRANDSVKQGQVIGKAGSSGFSTGPHLHFEIRVGSNSSASAVDPLTYISQENPRPVGGGGSSSEFMKMLHHFEGSCNAPRKGSNYIVHDDGVQIATVGYGVALKYNVENFKKYGIDVTNMKIDKNNPYEIPIDIVDSVESLELESFRQYVNNYLAKASITLADYQVDCLVMVAYQFGDLGNFATMYKKYGNTEQLRQNTKDADGAHYFAWNPSTGNGRAEATWKLFNQGIYTYSDKC